MKTSVKNKFYRSDFYADNQKMLLWMASTSYGRDLLRLPKDLGKIVLLNPGGVTAFEDVKNGRFVKRSVFVPSDFYLKTILRRWREFCEYVRYYEENELSLWKRMVSADKWGTIPALAGSIMGLPFPVFVGTTSTFNPNSGNPGTTSCDGQLAKADNSNWDTTHDATDAASLDPDGDGSGGAGWIETATGLTGGSNYIIYRVKTTFDSSSIPDADPVDSATYSQYILSTSNGDNDGSDFISVVTSDLTSSDKEYAVGDFDLIGSAIDNPTEQHAVGQRKDIGSISTSAYLDWTLDATGIANVSKTARTEFGTREGHDIIDSAYAGSAATRNNIRGVTADDGVNNQPPKLTVVHGASTRSPSGGAAYGSPMMY